MNATSGDDRSALPRPRSLRHGYGNFQDPLRLALRMVRSGDRAALAALAREAARWPLAPIDAILQPWERRAVQSARLSSLPIVLIVGAPRSGTTLVYQFLAHYLDVSYFTNLTALFPRSPLTIARLSQRLLRRRPLDFHSYYGQTPGLGAPNDGFHVWNRWLGADRYRVREPISREGRQEMAAFFNAWLSTFGKPLLNKNNRNTTCVSFLASIFPNAYFVAIRRDPIHVVQSLIRARKQIQGSKLAAWGVGSRATPPTADALAFVDDICDQVLELDQQLSEQLREVGGERVVEFTYERFCADPIAAAQYVAQTVPGVALHADRVAKGIAPFSISNKSRVATDIFNRIAHRIVGGSAQRSNSISSSP